MLIKFPVEEYPSIGVNSRKVTIETDINKVCEPLHSCDGDGYDYGIQTSQHKLWFKEESDRDRAYNHLKKLMNKTQSPSNTADFGIMDSIKDFLKEHKNLIMWICVAVLLDQFILKGAFRARIKNMVESALNKFAPKSD